MTTKTVRIKSRVGYPRSGVLLAPGATVEMDEVWADRLIKQGKAVAVEPKKKEKK